MRRRMPPPTAFTAQDAFHIAVGVICIPVGTVILLRTMSVAIAPPALLVGGAFVLFGVHRLFVAGTRLRIYRQTAPRAAPGPASRSDEERRP